MAEPTFSPDAQRIALTQAAWGGVLGAIGLMVGTALGGAAQVVVVALAFLLGGFVAGARAPGRRIGHALLSAVIGYAVFAVFVGIAWLISRYAGPDPPRFDEGGRSGVALLAVLALAAAGFGGALAVGWRSPPKLRGDDG